MYIVYYVVILQIHSLLLITYKIHMTFTYWLVDDFVKIYSEGGMTLVDDRCW